MSFRELILALKCSLGQINRVFKKFVNFPTDLMIEGRGTEDKARFLEIARTEGLRAAVAWRDARFGGSE